MKLIECVPNFSEGRDMAVVNTIRDSIAAVSGVTILHVTSDASHNRSVITFVAPASTVGEAAIAGIRAARDNIDLTVHTGAHPRIGAADVVPFVPLSGATMEDCIAIAGEVGRRTAEELGIPVYLYERAATRPSRRNLADIRRGGFETLRDVIGSDPDRVPDFGQARVHPTAGAVVIGARPFLIAFNMYLGDASHLPEAKEIARAVRESSGGLPAVKALGLDVDGQAQVSMNLVDTDRTPISVTYATVEREARTRGLEITWSEVIGLIPERVALDVASRSLKLRDDISDHVLERVITEARTDHTMAEFIDTVADSRPIPGGGTVAAIAGALGSALVSMVAGLTLGRARYAAVEGEMRDLSASAQKLTRELQELASLDSAAYAHVTDARRLPHGTAEETERRDSAVRAALLHAIEVPLRTARLAEQVARLAGSVAERGNSNAITDAGVAALLASAACTGASYNVRVNVISLRDPSDGAAAAAESIALANSAMALAASVTQKVNAAL